MKKTKSTLILLFFMIMSITFSQAQNRSQGNPPINEKGNINDGTGAVWVGKNDTTVTTDALSDHYAIIKGDLQRIIERNEAFSVQARDETKFDQRMDARDAAEHLEKAEIEYAKLENSKLPKEIKDGELASYRSSVLRHNKAAVKHANLLLDELKITYPEYGKVKEYAKAFNEAIESADKAYELLKTKLK